jgi:hypothetical protein
MLAVLELAYHLPFVLRRQMELLPLVLRQN